MGDRSESASEQEVEHVSVSAKFDQALKALDTQAPLLTYMGLAFWMVWNTIAFSGAFWLQDIDNNVRTENLMLVHLISCVASLALATLFSKHVSKFISKNVVTLLGGAIAGIGTVLILATSAPTVLSRILFDFGCVLTGLGTTLLFLRAAPLFGCLPPHRALYTLALCEMLSFCIFFILDSCPRQLAMAGFVLLPVVSALLFCVRRRDVRGENTVLTTDLKLPKRYIPMLLSIVLCGMAFELVLAHNLIALPPAHSVTTATLAQLVCLAVMLIVMVVTAIVPSSKTSYSGLYSITTGALVVLLVGVSLFPLKSLYVTTVAWTIRTCFNMTVWAMLYYLVFQSKANAIKLLSLGNGAAALGTLLASLLSVTLFELDAIADYMDIILAGFGIVMLVVALVIFSSKQLDRLLPAIDETALRNPIPVATSGQVPGIWDDACKSIAESHGLSKRETEVFIALAHGSSAQDFADEHVLSIYTVRAHIRNIYAKLDVHSHKELVAFVKENAQS